MVDVRMRDKDRLDHRRRYGQGDILKFVFSLLHSAVDEIFVSAHFKQGTASRNFMRGTDKWVDIESHDSTAEALAALRREGYRIVATTPHRESCSPETFDVTKGKFVLVFGTEHAGISDEVIAEADEFLKIPMCGMVESLNVSASAAILVYMLSERMRHEVEGWQLSDEEYHEILYRWSRESVRDDENVLKRQYGDDF